MKQLRPSRLWRVSNLQSAAKSIGVMLLQFPAPCIAQAEKRPNILMIVIDDIGYGDISAHGHSWLKTPNLDRLHDESVRMTDFRVSPTIQGRKLIVEHPEGEKALHVRRGWTREDVINLANKEGLPASPFRTDRD